MASYKEIVTKAVIGKGKKTFTTTNRVILDPKPTTVLGCWVINHNFKGYKTGDKINLEGSYDVNIWYSYDNDTKTDVVRQTNNYLETVFVKKREDSDLSGEEIIVRSLKQPSCTKTEIVDGSISYTIEKELGIELVGDTKVKIAIDEAEEPWDDILDSEEVEALDHIEDEVEEDYMNSRENQEE